MFFNYQIFDPDLGLKTGEKVQVIFLTVALLFMVFSMLGWVLELFFRRFFSAKKWINPGFLKGPYLPIYGFGVSLMFLLVSLLKPLEAYFTHHWVFDIVMILLMGILMTLLELIGGIVFIKGMNIKLWDYSNRPGNYKGIICPLFSIIWMVAGAVFYYLLYNPILNLVVHFFRLNWNTIAVFLIGIFYGIVIIDLCISLKIGLKLKKFAKENEFVLRFEAFKADLKMDLLERKEKSHFLDSFKSDKPLSEHVKEYSIRFKEKLKEEELKREEKKKEKALKKASKKDK